MSVRKKEKKKKNTNGDGIISFFVKKSTGTKRLFIDFFFQRILGAFARNARTNDDAPLSSLKRLLGRCYFGLESVTSFQLFFRKVCIMDVASLIFREFDQIYTPPSKRMLRFS